MGCQHDLTFLYKCVWITSWYKKTDLGLHSQEGGGASGLQWSQKSPHCTSFCLAPFAASFCPHQVRTGLDVPPGSLWVKNVLWCLPKEALFFFFVQTLTFTVWHSIGTIHSMCSWVENLRKKSSTYLQNAANSPNTQPPCCQLTGFYLNSFAPISPTHTENSLDQNSFPLSCLLNIKHF